ncbi:dihydroneopterin aldolase [Entomomonas asaccharolytica]|uniref:7,8-dihydroneopterin aldolase n=1 Tax=Entomomonas asaccharolytica TaxID=2785331 RepID=A0A974NIA3_9GAMM|nr:dihydroneopterin aldolase [Entomomonas asaccharolytica]QQP87133.1 dihydroneopterin aldolase [Entomomonas asaccharolytica]
MDIVFIENLEVSSVIGVYDWERTIQQCLIIDLQMAWDNKPAAIDDDITKALDYAKVSEAIEKFAANSQFQLVETFAEQLATLLMQQFNIPWLQLKITKPGAVPAAKGVGVEIERGCR